MDAIEQAFTLVFNLQTMLVIAGASLFGLFVGAVPGLTATMATALLVPVTFFMPPIPAVAAIVTATAMAIFSGDIPGCLLRMPGTPASAAYTDEAYAMTRKGQAELALGAGLVFSAIGGLFGTAVLIGSAPVLAEFALRFSSFEYFWLVLLGLTCAIVVTAEQPLKGFVSLLIGLAVSSIGLGNPAGFPRFTGVSLPVAFCFFTGWSSPGVGVGVHDGRASCRRVGVSVGIRVGGTVVIRRVITTCNQH